ncbi:MAG: ATP-binding cassette domain-containing protein, partial [Rhizobiales bacterium]|nr:ATP-binding cassette domain-containing protein [Hyphomicrobiales bacterium]
MLVAEEVVVRFRDAQGASFESLRIERMPFEPGKLTAVSGPSGSGKTTLLLTLAGLIAPAAGRVLWNGEAISSWPEAKRDAWRCRNAGLVFQDFQLIPELSPLANVVLPGSFGGRPNRDSIKARGAALMEQLG